MTDDPIVAGFISSARVAGAVVTSPAVRKYLSTRIVELLVHADDLARSVGMEPPELPTDAATIALELLLDSARGLHGDLDVLRALTRPERTRPPVPSVF